MASVAALALTALLSGCASSGGGASGGGGGNSVLDKVLGLAGLQTKPSIPEVPQGGLPPLPKLPQKVTLRIHAGSVLNTDTAGRSLALVAKIYKLKSSDQIAQAPYDAFKDAPSGKPPGVDGILEVREIVLTPGQTYEVVETLGTDVTHIAIVGLFRAPDAKRWRFVFETKTAAPSGITMGAHGCAWSVSEGTPVGAPPDTLRLAGVRCR